MRLARGGGLGRPEITDTQRIVRDNRKGFAMNDVRFIKGPPAVYPRQLVERIREYLAGTSVLKGILFGSFARGDADFASDADLMLVEENDRSLSEK